jgi:hypothetical protein
MEQGESPVDLAPVDPEGEGDWSDDGLLWSSATIIIASFILLLANAVSLSDWIEDMPPSQAQAQAAEIAADWRDATDQLGLAAPRDWLHGWWKRAEAARFGSSGN